MGKSSRQAQNALQRRNGEEPVPGLYAGVKRHARYLSRVVKEVKIKNPDKFLHASRCVR